MPQAAPTSAESALNLESLAADVVALAMKAGASDAESVIREGDEFSVNVRMGLAYVSFSERAPPPRPPATLPPTVFGNSLKAPWRSRR
jgi:hypothetical protein